MKKKILLIIMTFFAIIGVAKADMGAPETIEYELIVVKKEGVDYVSVDYNVETHEETKTIKHLDYNTKVKVMYEYTMNPGERSYVIDVNDEKYATVTSLDGFALLKDELDPTSLSDYNSGKTGNVLVYAKDGVDMYKGPSFAYSKVENGNIPAGTKLKYTYHVSEGVFMYVEYNGKKGWISSEDAAILYEVNPEQYYIFTEDTQLSCTTIPKNTVLKSSYKTNMWSMSNLFKYQSCEGLLKTFRSGKIIMLGLGRESKTLKEVKLYKYYDNKNEVLATIPKEETVYVYTSQIPVVGGLEYFYVEYNGLRGWIDVEEDYGTVLKYVEDGKKIIYTPEIQSKPIEVTDEEQKEEKEEETSTEEVKEEIKNNEDSTNKSDPKTFILTCVIVALSIAVIALTTIIIINKRKKDKTDNKLETIETPVQEDTTTMEETKTEETSIDSNNIEQ